ncbi:MAG TPA: alpha-ketoacid dehydrogenase subunit beta [Candidatus Omnitrophica bacterium]|nr:alpha-ketoacid dehydrogenase subunit beta [Candidatus Omnitrophota bacterium]
MRRLTYAEAINEATYQMMEEDSSVFLIGQGVTSPWYVGTTTEGLLEKFGGGRVIDTPVSENGITGVATGAAIVGMRPILIHPRMDFMYLAMDQIVNQAANWSYMFGGKVHVPLTIRGIINRGGEQAAQHSQALQAIFSHIPGLRVVMPATPYDAKGLLVASVKDNNPVIYTDDRWLYSVKGNVPEELFLVPIGKGAIRKRGEDVTLVGVSYTVYESLKAARELEREGISVEAIDLRTVKPLDKELLFESVRKTGRLVIADSGWRSFGVSAEVSATVSENLFEYLKSPPVRVTLPDTPAPSSSALEKLFYPTKDTIISAIEQLFR